MQRVYVFELILFDSKAKARRLFFMCTQALVVEGASLLCHVVLNVYIHVQLFLLVVYFHMSQNTYFSLLTCIIV